MPLGPSPICNVEPQWTLKLLVFKFHIKKYFD